MDETAKGSRREVRCVSRHPAITLKTYCTGDGLAGEGAVSDVN